MTNILHFTENFILFLELHTERRQDLASLSIMDSYFTNPMNNSVIMLAPYYDPNLCEAGCDEAGRGRLAGPVFAAAVVLPKTFRHPLLNDSKQLTEQQRLELRCIIKAAALSWAVAQVDPAEIDEVNILNASFLAMHRALDQLEIKPELILVDGNRFTPYKNVDHQCVVKGDSIYMSIAAASILAKTYRDDYMANLADDHPQYGWTANKGYPTKAHREALRHHGPTPHHRRSFRLLPEQLALFS